MWWYYRWAWFFLSSFFFFFFLLVFKCTSLQRNPCPPCWRHGVLTTGPIGKSLSSVCSKLFMTEDVLKSHHCTAYRESACRPRRSQGSLPRAPRLSPAVSLCRAPTFRTWGHYCASPVLSSVTWRRFLGFWYALISPFSVPFGLLRTLKNCIHTHPVI